MNIKCYALLAAGFVILTALRSQAQSAISRGKPDKITDNDSIRTITPFFTPATTSKKGPGSDGFIQRWVLLEPVNKAIRTNLVFTNNYLKAQFDTAYFPNQFTVIPKDRDKVKVGEQELAWHALESTTFNVKLI